MIIIILLLVVALPIAWFISEFQPSRGLRVVLGVAALSMSFGVAWVVGSLERLNLNSLYGAASKDLIENTIVELENGNTDRVIQGMRKLRSGFHPSYETHDDFDKKVDEYLQAISNSPIRHDPGDPSWAGE
ncbi:hypothetical protein [Adhaeretor mobilis]|uniref:DUF4239 domain-containing protein n=1 Tax=Adhaeretor mobilis TaxID=1930276 RepID=A0A517MUL6_9BACT|nr:hypothetical protein [Adhaeretor mobilis]QDS98569.1 hypothetical protein HG15A2_18500 [Adhaeretor mobilis]